MARSRVRMNASDEKKCEDEESREDVGVAVESEEPAKFSQRRHAGVTPLLEKGTSGRDGCNFVHPGSQLPLMGVDPIHRGARLVG